MLKWVSFNEREIRRFIKKLNRIIVWFSLFLSIYYLKIEVIVLVMGCCLDK